MKFIFLGNIMLGRLVNDWLNLEDAKYPWGNTLKLLSQADLRICNLSCVFADFGVDHAKDLRYCHFRSDCKNVEVLKRGAIDAVSLANDHLFDFENAGLRSTINILNTAGIAYGGAGENEFEAMKPIVLEKNEIKIAIISFTDGQSEYQAVNENSGLFHVPIDENDERAQKLFNVIRQARDQSDFLIVSVDWKMNFNKQPSEEYRNFARVIMDYGADVIFGHSAFGLAGIEYYEGKPIIYSTGNFISDCENECNSKSFVFFLEKNGDKMNLKLYPVEISNFQAKLIDGYKAEEMAIEMQKLCLELRSRAHWNKQGQYLEVCQRRVL